MNQLEDIRKNYSTFSDEKLLKLVDEVETLKSEAIILLQEELLKRNRYIEVTKITKYLIEKKEELVQKTNFNPKNYIREELNAGETLENIKFKLNNMEINMFDVINDENLQEKSILDYIESQKMKGFSKQEIKNNLIKNFNLNSEYLDVLENKLNIKGRKNIRIGIILMLLSIFGSICIFLVSGGNVSIPMIILFGIGIWRIVEGEHQLRKY